jgi:hypothetical protein
MGKLLVDGGPFVMENMIAGSTFLGHFCVSRGQPQMECRKKRTRFYLDAVLVKAG